MRRVALLAGAALLALAPAADAKRGSPNPNKKVPYSVGAAKVEANPDKPVCLGGYGFCQNGGGRTMTGVRDTLYARALAIGRKDDALILVHTTNIGFFASYKTIKGVGIYHLRQAVAKRTGVPAGQVIVQSDHSHAGPDTIGIWGGVPPEYLKKMQDAAVDAAVAAWQARRPARLYSGAVNGPGVTSSYDEPEIDLGDNFENVKVDERFHLLWANDRETGERIATFANYSPHATVLGSGNKEASGDWPEWAAQIAEARFGGGGIAGVGTLGREDFGAAENGDAGEAEARARLETMMTLATANGTEIEPGRVRVRSVYIQEPLAQPILALNALPEGTLSGPTGMPEIGGMDVSIDREPAPPWLNAGTIGTYAGAARVGDLFIGMSPGEPFPQIQFYLREEKGITGAREHLHLGAANDFLGYMVRPLEAYPEVAKDGVTYLGGCPEDLILGVLPIDAAGSCTDHWTLMVSPTIGSHVACTIQDAGEALGFTAANRARECDAVTATDGRGAPAEYAPAASTTRSTAKRRQRRS